MSIQIESSARIAYWIFSDRPPIIGYMRMSWHFGWQIGLGVWLAFPAWASEVDNFTRRPTDPKEWEDRAALDTLNLKTNELMSQALAKVQGCDLRQLHRSVKESLGGGEVGKLEAWAIKHPGLKKVEVAYGESIYAEAGIKTASPGLVALGAVPSFMLGGHYVGADKFGHFFDQGFGYYEAIHLKYGDAARVIESSGLADEDGLNGMIGNGIRSYGDMAANFSGFTFWREVAAGPNPYYACVGGKFKRTARSFDWSEYVSDAWDEGINCSEFSPSVGAVVKKALAKRGVSCPVAPERCQTILAQPCGFTFISPACLAHVQAPAYSDTSCSQLLENGAGSGDACVYKPGLEREPAVAALLDLLDGAKSVVGIRGEQAAKWGERQKNGASRKLQEILRGFGL